MTKFMWKRTRQIIETDVPEKIKSFRANKGYVELDENGKPKPKKKVGRPKKEETEE